MSGLILINKPCSITSFKVVSIVKKLFNTKKVGHAGTLDPLATGVLLVLINKATKVQDLLLCANKEYIAEFKLGMSTDTEDITGKVVSKNENTKVTKEQIEKILPKFTGEIEQIPPMYSAISKNGIRLYNLARKGIEVKREARKITINKLKLLDFDESSKEAKILVNCSKGTYIRTLCSDIGSSLNCGATLTSLKRTKSGNFSIEDCISLNDLEKMQEKNILHRAIVPIEDIFTDYKSVFLNEAQEKMFTNGRKFSYTLEENMLGNTSNLLKVFNQSGSFLGLGEYKKRELAVHRLLIE